MFLKIYKNWEKLYEDLSILETLQHCRTSITRILEFKNTSYNPSTRNDHNINQNCLETAKMNHSITNYILKSIELYRRNGITLPSHQEEGALNSTDISKKSRNLKSLINFWINAGNSLRKSPHELLQSYNIIFKKQNKTNF